MRKVTDIKPCHFSYTSGLFGGNWVSAEYNRGDYIGNIDLMNSIYSSAINREVKVAEPGEFAPVQICPIRIWPPVILAPMAGVTNYPFRSVCRRFGAGLYVSEMINARPLVDGQEKTLKLAGFGPDEAPRSLQLYGTDPY